MSECPRHDYLLQTEHYRAVRCCHIGTEYVVDIVGPHGHDVAWYDDRNTEGPPSILGLRNWWITGGDRRAGDPANEDEAFARMVDAMRAKAAG